MTARRTHSLLSMSVLVALTACQEATPPVASPLASGPFRRAAGVGEWSAPVWLGPVVNSVARDWRPVMSDDGLRLYFHSNRDGGVGGYDIWVSRRAGRACPWEAPVNVGTPINSASNDGDASFSPGGRLMFFSSEGHGSVGAGDILVARRSPGSAEEWEAPQALGPEVNTTDHESNPAFVASENGGTLYFERGLAANNLISNIYKVGIASDGSVQGSPVIVTELAAPGLLAPHAPSVSSDGRYMVFWSNSVGTPPPAGSVGQADVWESTRQSAQDNWSTPVNLGIPVNFTGADLSPTLSQDGRTLFLTSAQARGGSGLQDLWMATREPSAPGSASGCSASDP